MKDQEKSVAFHHCQATYGSKNSCLARVPNAMRTFEWVLNAFVFCVTHWGTVISFNQDAFYQLMRKYECFYIHWLIVLLIEWLQIDLTIQEKLLVVIFMKCWMQFARSIRTIFSFQKMLPFCNKLWRITNSIHILRFNSLFSVYKSQ